MPEPGPTDTAPDLQAAGERIDALLDASAAAGVVARERAEELVRLVTDLYGAGIERLLDILHEAGRLDDDVLAAIASDELVSSLLIVHGLHPYDVADRVEQALEGVRPYLGSHGGDVELLAVTDDGAVRLRLLGSCDGCPSSSVTLKLAVEGAIEAAAPEISTIEVETTAPTAEPSPLIPVESLTSRLHEPGGGAAGWHVVPGIEQLAAGAVGAAVAGQTAIVVCRVAAELFAFMDRCPRCEGSLGQASVARRLGGKAQDAVLTCPSCRTHYDVRRAGACLDVPDLHLDPLPLLGDGGSVSVAVPAPVVA